MNITLKEIKEELAKKDAKEFPYLVIADQDSDRPSLDLLANVLFLLMEDTKEKEIETERTFIDLFNKEYEFIVTDGGMEVFMDVSSYEEITEQIIRNDTSNQEKGDTGAILGVIEEGWVDFIDKKAVTDMLKKWEHLLFSPELKTAVRYY